MHFIHCLSPDSSPPLTASSSNRKFPRQRERLVEHLRERGIHDEHVLDAIGRVPRHKFVQPAFRDRAYADEALPIGLNQTISQPFTVAYQTMLLDVHANDRVLEVGTGSGYQAAVLCEMDARVFSIERHQSLLRRTRERFDELDYRVRTMAGDGSKGWPAFAPYDAIVVTAGAEEIPQPLIEQLRIPNDTYPGGRLVIPVGNGGGQRMMRLQRTGPDLDNVETKSFDTFRFVPLVRSDR